MTENKIPGTDSAPILPTPGLTPKAVGYSVLNTESTDGSLFCVVAPHVSSMLSAAYDSVLRRIRVVTEHAELLLPDVPDNLAEAIRLAPASVTIISVDTFSRPRSSVALT